MIKIYPSHLYNRAKKSSNSLKNFFFKKTLNYVQVEDGSKASFAYLLLLCLGELRMKILYTDLEMDQKLIS